MMYRVTLLLLLNFGEFGLTVRRPDSNCDFSEILSSRQVTSFKNPNWPATYLPGSICRWTFECNEGFACRLRCFDVGLPQTDDCYMDKLLVSGTGSPKLTGAQVFCGRTEINFSSNGSKLTLALVASPLSPGGRFRCTIKSEPSTQTSSAARRLQKVKASRFSRTETHANNEMARPEWPHTGLVQSRIPQVKYEIARAPHAKNFEVQEFEPKFAVAKPLPGKYVSQESSRSKYLKAEPTYFDHVEDELAAVKRIKSGSVYQGHVDHRPTRVEKILKTPSMQSRIGSSMVDNLPAEFLISNSIKVESPFVATLEEGSPAVEIIQKRNAGKRFDRRAPQQSEAPRRKHKISREALSSLAKRIHGLARPVKHVQAGTRHVRHELIREPKSARSRIVKADIHRITHRTGLLNTKRVHTHVKHTTNQVTVAPYSRGVRSNNGQPIDVFLNGL